MQMPVKVGSHHWTTAQNHGKRLDFLFACLPEVEHQSSLTEMHLTGPTGIRRKCTTDLSRLPLEDGRLKNFSKSHVPVPLNKPLHVHAYMCAYLFIMYVYTLVTHSHTHIYMPIATHQSVLFLQRMVMNTMYHLWGNWDNKDQISVMKYKCWHPDGIWC